MKHIKYFNESIKQHLKPKPTGEILKSLMKMSIDERINYIFKYKLFNTISKDIFKKWINKLMPLEIIQKINDNNIKIKDVYNNTELKELFNKLKPLDRVHMIYNCGLKMDDVYDNYEMIDIIKLLNEVDANKKLKLSYSLKIPWLLKNALDNGADMHFNNDWDFLGCVMSGHIEMVKIFLDKGIDIHLQNDYALALASHYNKPDMVKFLLDNGADINKIDIEEMNYLKKEGYNDVIKVLKDWSNDINESIKGFLKPKSEDDIRKTFDTLTPSQKMRRIRQYSLNNMFTEDEIKNFQKQVEDEINKVVNKYKKEYNSDFFEKFIKLFPNVEKHNETLENYLNNFMPDTGEELTDDDYHYIYDEYYTDAYKDMLDCEFEELPINDLQKMFEICMNLITDLENVGW